jgi:hypothetical protein
MSAKALPDSRLPVGSIVAYVAFCLLLAMLQAFWVDAFSKRISMY